MLTRRDALLDWSGRLAGAGLFAFLLVREARTLVQLIRERASWPTADAMASRAAEAAVFARAAVVAYLALTVVFFLVRRPAQAKSDSIVPRVTALGGAFLLFSLLLLPTARLSPAENLMAAALITAGNLLSIAGVAALGRSFSVFPEARRLVQTGPYAIVRHPLYLAQEIALVGVTWYYRSPAALALFLVHFAVQVRRMSYEERVLTGAFPEYEAYRQRTARLIPGLY